MNDLELLMSQCEIYVDTPKERVGGQVAGMVYYPTVIEHKDLGVKISVNYHKSQYKNRDLVKTLMELAIIDLIKTK
tara:strand:- start:10074 stop:10301 length:228 start_codon:yes stop_codon:yes gene_type:complete